MVQNVCFCLQLFTIRVATNQTTANNSKQKNNGKLKILNNGNKFNKRSKN